MTDQVALRCADGVVMWKTYVLALDDVCRAAGVQVPRGAELEAEIIDRTAMRIVVKTSD